MADTGSTVFVFATAVTNLFVAVYSGRESLKKAKESSNALRAVQERTRLDVSEVTTEITKLTSEVAGLSSSISKEFRMFNARFKDAQDHLTMVLTALVGDRDFPPRRNLGDDR